MTPTTDGGGLSVRLLGQFQIVAGGRIVIDRSWPRRKAMALVKLLALQPGRSMHREAVFDALWPELDTQAAANNFRQCTHHLRSALAAAGVTMPLVSAHGSTIALAPDALVDVEEFRAMAARARKARSDAGAYEDALALYAGDLLPEDVYEPWTERPRDEARSLHIALLLELSRLHTARGLTEDAASCLHRLLTAEPAHEDAHRALMHLHVQTGARHHALRQYQACRDALERELGVEPSEETRAVYREICEGHLRPPVGASASNGTFIGREREMDELRGYVDEALGGQGRVVLIGGEPGIGKTRTAEELAAYARLRGAVVLWGRCYESEGAPAYWPWVQAIRGYASSSDPDDLRRALGPGAAEIAQMVPELRDRLPGLPEPQPATDAERARFLLFDAIASFVKSSARTRPLMLVIDDLHRADEPSLRLLRFMARELRDARVLIAGSYRDTEVRDGDPFGDARTELAREPVSRRSTLEGLSQENVARLIEQATGAEPPRAVAAAVYQKTDGNPFFISEFVRTLARGSNGGAGMSWTHIEIPASVRDVIRQRRAGLSGECQRVLAVGAAIGREFEAGLVSDCARVPHGAVAVALEEALSARVITNVAGARERFRFVHALIMETLYDDLGLAQRAAVHRDIAEVLEKRHEQSRNEDIVELAHHFLEASSDGRDIDKAVEYVRRAGQSAMALLAYEDAAKHYEVALRTLGRVPDADAAMRASLLLDAADAYGRSSDMAQARESARDALAIARSTADIHLVTRAALSMGPRAMWDQQSSAFAWDEEVMRAHAEAIDMWPAVDDPLYSRLCARFAVGLEFALDARAESFGRKAIEMARRLDDPVPLLETLCASHASWLFTAHEIDERLRTSREIIDLSRKLGDREREIEGLQFRAVDLLETGDRAAAEAALHDAREHAEALRQPYFRYFCTLLSITFLTIDGRFEEAEKLAVANSELGKKVLSPGWSEYLLFGIQLAAIRDLQGRHVEAEPWTRSIADGLGHLHPATSATLAYACCRTGQLNEARQIFERLANDRFASLNNDRIWLLGMTRLAYVCSALGDTTNAAILSEMLQPFADHVVIYAEGGACYPPVAHYVGMLVALLERWDEAEQAFEHSRATLTRMEAPALIVQTQYEYARMLATRGAPGDAAAARARAEQAHNSATALGMLGISASSDVLLSQL